MNKKPRLFSLLMIAALFLGACNLPSNSQGEGLSLTAAAQTVEVLLSAMPAGANTNTPLPLPLPATLTPLPLPILTNTPLPPPTSTCNVMQFMTDVTIPDGTIMTPGQTFTKTWRLKNIGACAWTPSYAIAFSDGNAMNGPSTQAMVGTVNPGQTIDISVNLTAPASTGDYTGNWKLRDGSGVLFGKFYVQIKVQNPPTATNTLPSSHTVNLAYMAGESGLVLNDGSVNALTVAAGDSPGNLGVEAFLSFDISGVPSGSTIQNASILLKGGSQVRADPFATLGCLRAYVQNYGVVDASDFVPVGAVGAITRWCNTAELETPYSDAGFIAAVQSSVGTSRFQIRLQFKDTLTDSDGTIDDVLILAPVTLTITYSP
ncbi:MAG: NBR1-Ig-like domain-containing protein [Anaerolineales bacterium]|nr:NBR1-Ig-like domain-containing protein [Anaerolineales bacterium]